MTHKTPFFSIIIPSYNRVSKLSAAINSVCKQKFKDWECIVVDDGSTDGTEELVKNLMNADQRIRYIFQENAERCAARNNGIKIARGQYICFLDSDDEYTDDHLKRLKEAIESLNNPVSLFFTQYQVVQNGILSKGPMLSINGKQTDFLLTHSIIPDRVCVHQKILEKEKFDEDITVGEDALLWTRIAQNFPVIALDQATVLYHVHDDNTINIKNNSGEKRLFGLKTFFKRYPHISVGRKTKSKLFSEAYFSVAKNRIYHDERLSALKHIILSIYELPFSSHTKHKLYLCYCLIRNAKIPEYQKE